MITFELPDEETLLLKDTAERFIADRYDLSQRKRMTAEADVSRPLHWGEMADLGWIAAPVPEEAGGLGLTPKQVVPLISVLGAGLVLEPIGAVTMGCVPVLARVLPTDTVEAILSPILSGDSIEVMAAGAPQSPIRVVRDGDDYVLSGTAPLVMGGPLTQAFWVVCDLDGTSLIARVPAAEASVQPFATLDDQPAAKVTFDKVRCPADTVIMDCDAAIAYGTDLALVGKLAELSGLIDRLYRNTLDYVKLRQQFGRAIGSFQSVQHRMADMFIRREEALSMVMLAAEAMESDDAAFRSRLVAAAQAKVCENARAVLRDAVQFHGGMGVTDEMTVGHMVKRVLVLTQMDGGRAAGLHRFHAAA